MLNLNLAIPAENITRQYQPMEQEYEAAIGEAPPIPSAEG